MDVIKKMQPGDPGTKRLVTRYGEQLVCVRYRNDSANQRRLTTVELIVDEGFHYSAPNKRATPVMKAMQQDSNRDVLVRINFHETDLRELAKQAGGRWQPEQKRWILRYQDAQKLGLKERIEEMSDVDI